MPLSRTRLRFTATCLAASLAIPAAAGATPDTAAAVQAEEGPIIVTGTRADRRELNRMAEEFVQRTGVARGMVPAARWVEPICPRVLARSRSIHWVACIPHPLNTLGRRRLAAEFNRDARVCPISQINH